MPNSFPAIVVPCYNTSAACAEVIRQARRYTCFLVAVDDGSTDDTADYLRASGCRVLRLPHNQGKGAALAAAFRMILSGDAGSDVGTPTFVLTLDGDGQHDPADIPRLLERAASSGADLVLGMRQPSAMPRKSRIGSHFSRLLFLIGTATFVPDTQSGFRLYSVPLLAALIEQVTWRGYEAESEILWKAIDARFSISAVPVSTIYLDGNRRSQFGPWRDSTRIAAVFRRQLRWTIGMAWLDFLVFAVMVSTGALRPGMANVASRAIAVVCQATSRTDYVSRTARLARGEGAAWCGLAFVGHLATTTLLVIGLVRLGVHPIAAKAIAQLAGYLGSFAVIDRVLLARVRATAGR